MQIDRRQFLKLTAPVACLPLINWSSFLRATGYSAAGGASELTLLYDSSACLGCGICEMACTKKNGVSNTEVVTVKAANPAEKLYLKKQCMHCTEAACVEVCPAHALTHDEIGFVRYDETKCIGCGYCVNFCPFHVPELEGEAPAGTRKMMKCDFCADRLADGEQPACAVACPANALFFGARDQLISQARDRVATLKPAYPNATLYGADELAGLHLLLVLKDLPAAYGLPDKPELPLTVDVFKGIVKPAGLILGGLAVAGLAFNYAVTRVRARQGSV